MAKYTSVLIGAVFAPLWLPCPGFVIHRVAASATCSLLLEINYMYIRVFGTRNCPKIRVFGTNSAVWNPGVWYWKTPPDHRILWMKTVLKNP